MNLYKRVVNAVANVVYKTIARRGRDDAPNIGALNAYLAKRGMKPISPKKNFEIREMILSEVKHDNRV